GPLVRSAAGGTRRRAIEDKVLVRGWVVEVQNTEAPDAAHQRIDNPLRESAGENRVKSIAAGLQHSEAGFGRLRLRRNDHRLVGWAQALWLRHEESVHSGG